MLVLRQRLLNEAEQRYSRAIGARKDIEAKISAGWSDLDAMNDQVLAARSDRFNGAQQQSFFQAMVESRQKIKGLEESLKKAREIETAERTKYIMANRDHELLLKLKEKQKQKHFHEEMLKEQLQQDDLFNARRAVMNAAERS